MVQWADAIVADASYPSIGLGIELQIATEVETPIVLCFRRIDEHRAHEVEYAGPNHERHHLQIGEGYVSLMALGLPSLFSVVGYERTSDAIESVRNAILVLNRPSR